ncbi:hypothetical protein FAZ78_09085 [Cereibacter changlensis]|jgi:hypothetical protein|uniref:Uncharacterized protein n=1 Tax=Cereibacter changlensis TaxID=402884 RepID=A0A4U0Z2Y1_9RHOB|nr:hypothetical protein [Cereibacter changlensis]TKA96864.1 hypothetical protein FAZ78_09085 [Cereibacter changlensis]
MTAFAILSGFTLLIALLSTIGGLWLMAKQMVVVDASGTVTDVHIPFFGKLRTNYPSLAAVFLGIGLAVFVLGRIPVVTDKVPLSARIATGSQAGNGLIIVGAIPQRYLQSANVLAPGQETEVTFDVDTPGPYSVVAFRVAETDESNRAIYDVIYGPTSVETDQRRLHFNATFTDR